MLNNPLAGTLEAAGDIDVDVDVGVLGGGAVPCAIGEGFDDLRGACRG